MDARYVADRSLLLALCQQHPDWSNPTLAQATGRSLAWVKKWTARFRAEPDHPAVIWGHSRTSAPAAALSPRVIEQILAIRDHPPFPRAPAASPRPARHSVLLAARPGDGGRTAAAVDADDLEDPVLRANDRIAQPHRAAHQLQERPQPLEEVQLDFKDLVQHDPLATTKQAHAVEVFDAIDVGTSRWLLAVPSADYTAETVFAPLVKLLQHIGLPTRVRFDRDPRFWGGAPTPPCATSRPPSCGSGTRWAFSPWSIPRIAPI